MKTDQSPVATPKPQQPKLNGTIAAVSITLILTWGTAYTLIGYAIDHISPAWLVCSRTMIAACVLRAYVRFRGRKLPPLTDPLWRWYGLMGFIGMTTPFYLTAKGQTMIDSGLSSVLIGFMPLATIILAHFFVAEERLTRRKLIGFMIGFIGIALLFLPENLDAGLVKNWRAQGLVLMAATLYAVTTIIAKRAPKTYASVGAAMMVISAAFWALIWALSTGIPEQLPPPSAITAIIALAVGSTGFAQILYLYIIQITGPTWVAKINYIVPICAVIAGIIFLGEQVGIRTILALLVTFIGLYICRSKA